MNFKAFFLKEEEPIQSVADKAPVEVLRVTIPGIRELRDGLAEDTIRTKFDWLMKASFEDAVIGIKNGKIVWYQGTWIDGHFKESVWETGIFKNGKFSGVAKNIEWQDGTFVKGDIWSGTWKKGTFLEGSFKGTWLSGVWKGNEFTGTFKNGLFESGSFIDGQFMNGTFRNGRFINGEFNGGVFESGYWMNGKFNAKKAIWKSGIDRDGDILKHPPVFQD